MPLSPEMRGYNRIYKEFEDIYRDIDRWAGLSASAFGILYHLMDLGDGCLQRDICAEAFVSKQTVNSSIRSLERQGLIRLQPGRGRDMHIHFTEKGRRLAEDAALMLALQQRHLEIFRRRVRALIADRSDKTT